MNHSSDNHNTQSSIFNNTKDMMRQDLKLLNRRIKTARILLLVIGGLLLLSIVLAVSANRFSAEHVGDLILPGITLVVIVSALLSYKQPFIFLLIPTIFCCLGVLIGIYQSLFHSSPGITAIGTTAIQIVIVLYLVRGVIAAHRAKDLKQAIERQGEVG